MPKFGTRPPVPKHQADATLSQATPVQNTWYTILDTTFNCRIYAVYISVADDNETLQVKITIDGQTLTSQDLAATADTAYYLFLSWSDVNELYLGATDYGDRRAFMVEGRSIKIEVRKTTATGTGTLSGRVKHGKW